MSEQLTPPPAAASSPDNPEADMTENSVQRAVDRATGNTVFERAARGGHVMSGFVHLLIGYIVVRLAFGGGGTADQSGALGTLSSTTGGAIVLWIAVVVFVALGLWRLAET